MLINTRPLEGEILGPDNSFRLVLRPLVLKDQRLIFDVPCGASIEEMLVDYCLPHCRRVSLVVTVNGHVIPKENWRRVRLKPGVMVSVVGMPRGGAVRKILGYVVAAAGALLAPYLAGPIIGALGLSATGIGASLITAAVGIGINLATSMLMNALFPPPRAQLSNQETRSPTYSIGGGRNQARPFDVIPLHLGRNRFAPFYGANSYTEIIGDEQYLRMLFVWGYGPLDISDLKIGETPLANFEGVEIQTVQNHLTGGLSLYPSTVIEEQLAVELVPGVWEQRTTASGVTEISFDITWGAGLYRLLKKDGSRVPYTARVIAEYRLTGSGTWLSMGEINITSSSQDVVRRSLRISGLAAGQYDVRIQNPNTLYGGEDTVVERSSWTALRGMRSEPPIKSTVPLTVTALRIKASSELSGNIDTFNGIVTARHRGLVGSTWTANRVTSNPADQFRYVLQGPANARPKADAEIDLASLVDWFAFCAAEGFTFNQVRDFKSSVIETLKDITAAGRATLSMAGGRWGVIYDKPTATPVQLFTPRNSRGLVSNRAYTDTPHAFRVRFINSEKEFRQDEVIAYADGYNASNATKFEVIDFAGITTAALAVRHARFQMAQSALRREVYALETDWEHLVCTRGDRVLVQSDVTKWGTQSARVKALLQPASGPHGVQVDERITLEAGFAYSMRLRKANGQLVLKTITGPIGGESDSFFFTPGLFGVDADMPEVGDLVAFGQVTNETQVLRVSGIEPGPDLSARLSLVDDAPGIMDADTKPIPPFDSGLPPLINVFDLPPRSLRLVEDVDWTGAEPRSRVTASWLAPAGRRPAFYQIEYRRDGETLWLNIPPNGLQAAVLGLEAGAHSFRVRAVFDGFQPSRWLTGAINVVAGMSPPPAVTGFLIDGLGDMAQLRWQPSSNPFVAGYEIRYSPLLTGALWGSANQIAPLIIGSTASVSNRPGTYFLKAKTYRGIESATAATAIITLGTILNYNVVQSFNAATPFAGARDGTILSTEGYIELDWDIDYFARGDDFDLTDWFGGPGQRVPTGTIILDQVFDLGEVMSARLDVLITAIGRSGEVDYFARSDDFDMTDWFFDEAPAGWSVVTEVSATDDDPAGSPVWGPWTLASVGTVSGRAFRLKLTLSSLLGNVTPSVSGIALTFDVPDRIETFNDAAIAPGGTTFTFAPKFRSLQALAVTTIQGAATGDYAEITAKTTAGFTVRVFNAAGTGVARTVDIIAKGFGRVT